MLEGLHRLGTNGIDRHIELDAAGCILNCRETRFAHHAFQHDAAGNDDIDRWRSFKFFFGFCAVRRVQIRRDVLRAKIVWKGDTAGAQFTQRF